jgi:hypothetical protein
LREALRLVLVAIAAGCWLPAIAALIVFLTAWFSK